MFFFLVCNFIFHYFGGLFYVDLACSGPFWNKMESIFASISLDDASYLKQQVATGSYACCVFS